MLNWPQNIEHLLEQYFFRHLSQYSMNFEQLYLKTKNRKYWKIELSFVSEHSATFWTENRIWLLLAKNWDRATICNLET